MGDMNHPGYRQCIRDRLRTEILRRILDGRYPPDMHLKEMVLAKEFGTSQAPVREALRELEALGLVESQRYRGTRVLSAQLVDLQEAYELRALIEERSAQLAVPLSPVDIDTLASMVETMRVAAASHDSESYVCAALVFHRRLIELSGNSHFLKTYDAMHWGVRVRIAAFRKLCDLPHHAQEHAEILELLVSGEGVAAGAALRGMMMRVRDNLAKAPPDTVPSPLPV